MSDDPNIDPATIDPPAPPVAAEPPAVEPEPPAAPEPPPAPAKSLWYLQRISEESDKARREAERAAAAERRAQEAEALALRLQTAARGGEPGPAVTLPMPQAPANMQAEIQRAAAQQRFYEDTVDVRNRGITEYGTSFGETLNILSALGATSDEFIADVLAVDKGNAHAMLTAIAKDPEKAAALTQMTPRQRIAELTRLQMAETKPQATPASGLTSTPQRQVSKAPAPPPTVAPSASRIVDWRSDDASDDEFNAGFQEMLKKRNARR